MQTSGHRLNGFVSFRVSVVIRTRPFISGADLGLLAGGSQSVVVICHSTYEPGGGATHVSFYLHNG